MPRTISADGRTIVVPDDATDDEINQIAGPPKATTPPTFIDRAKSVLQGKGILSSDEALSATNKVRSLVGANPLTTLPSYPEPRDEYSLPEKIMLTGLGGSGVPGAGRTIARGLGGLADAANSPGAKDIVGMASPRAAHAMGALGRIAGALKKYGAPAEVPEPPQPPPTGLTITHGTSGGPIGPVKPLNIAGPMPPPAEGGFMPKVEPPQPPPKLITPEILQELHNRPTTHLSPATVARQTKGIGTMAESAPPVSPETVSTSAAMRLANKGPKVLSDALKLRQLLGGK